MIALMISLAVVIMLALAAGAYRLAFWRGYSRVPRPGRMHYPTDRPGFELSGYEQALRAMHRMQREQAARGQANQPSQP